MALLQPLYVVVDFTVQWANKDKRGKMPIFILL